MYLHSIPVRRIDYCLCLTGIFCCNNKRGSAVSDFKITVAGIEGESRSGGVMVVKLGNRSDKIRRKIISSDFDDNIRIIDGNFILIDHPVKGDIIFIVGILMIQQVKSQTKGLKDPSIIIRLVKTVHRNDQGSCFELRFFRLNLQWQAGKNKQQ